jgi:predicted PurR-regulated permease PerM
MAGRADCRSPWVPTTRESARGREALLRADSRKPAKSALFMTSDSKPDTLASGAAFAPVATATDASPASAAPTDRGRRPLLVLTLLAWTAVTAAVVPFVPALTWALVLAIVAQPLQRGLRPHVRHANTRAAIVMALLLLAIVLPAAGLAPLVSSEATQAWEELRSESVQSRLDEFVRSHAAVAPVVNWLREYMPDGRDIVARLTSQVGKLVGGSVWIGLQWLVAFLAAFYLLRDAQPMQRWLHRHLPLAPSQLKRLQRRTVEVVEASAIGTLAVAIVQGVLGGLIFWTLGLPAPLLWGLVMAVLSVLPVLGAALVWMPVAAFLALEGNWPHALVLVAWGAIVVGLIDNLLYPVLVGRKLRMHTLPVFVAVLGGLVVLGVTGLVLGPLALALAMELLSLWRIDSKRAPSPPHQRLLPRRPIRP